MIDECGCNNCTGTPAHIGAITVKPQWRNHGYSLGLDHPYIYGQCFNRWLVWHRHTGVVAHMVPKRNWKWFGSQESEAMDICYKLNGLSQIPDAETLNAIDMTP